MADLKDNKSNPATAAAIRVKAEAMGMDSLKDLEDAIEAAAAEKKAKAGKKTTRGASAASLQKLDDEVVIARVKTEQAQSARMLAVQGQPGYAGKDARLAIVPVQWRMYHGVPETWFVESEKPDPYQQYSIVGMNDLANGALAFGEHQATVVSPYVEFKGVKAICVGHILISKPKFTAPLGQAAFTGTPAALKLVFKSGGAKAVDWYLKQTNFEIPVYIPMGQSPSGVSSALAVTVGANELIGAMCLRDAGSAATVRTGIFGILKKDFGYGDQTVVTTADGKDSHTTTTMSIVGVCEVLAHYDVKTAFCIWKKAPKEGESSAPVFYNTENMTGGVVGLMYHLAQNIALQMEKRSKPMVVKPVDEVAVVKEQVMHEEMMKLVDANQRLAAENAALKKTLTGNNGAAAEKAAMLKTIADLQAMATRSVAKTRWVQNSLSVAHGSEEAYKTAIAAHFGVSHLVAASKQVPLVPIKKAGVAGAAAAATAAAPAASPYPTATGMEINNQS